jgi:hypothetical protein
MNRDEALADYSDHVSRCSVCVTWINQLCVEGRRLFAIVEDEGRRQFAEENDPRDSAFDAEGNLNEL